MRTIRSTRFRRLVVAAGAGALLVALSVSNLAPIMAPITAEPKGPPPATTDSCGYPNNSGGARTSTAFSESTMLTDFYYDNSAGKVYVWMSDEHATILGQDSAASQVSRMALNVAADSVSQPSVGDVTAKDTSERPIYPALFVNGDWQLGGTPLAPSQIWGSWKYIAAGGGTTNLGSANDPALSNQMSKGRKSGGVLDLAGGMQPPHLSSIATSKYNTLVA